MASDGIQAEEPERDTRLAPAALEEAEKAPGPGCAGSFRPSGVCIGYTWYYLLPRSVDAREAIFAARMAFSSFAVLSLLM